MDSLFTEIRHDSVGVEYIAAPSPVHPSPSPPPPLGVAHVPHAVPFSSSELTEPTDAMRRTRLVVAVIVDDMLAAIEEETREELLWEQQQQQQQQGQYYYDDGDDSGPEGDDKEEEELGMEISSSYWDGTPSISTASSAASSATFRYTCP